MADKKTITRGTDAQTVLHASAWMVGLSVALFWIPAIGPFIAGFVGGKKAGAIFPAIVAVFLPSLVIGFLSFFVGGMLGGIPIIGQLLGAAFAMAGWAVSTMQVGPLLIGALVGGWTSNKPSNH